MALTAERILDFTMPDRDISGYSFNCEVFDEDSSFHLLFNRQYVGTINSTKNEMLEQTTGIPIPEATLTLIKEKKLIFTGKVPVIWFASYLHNIPKKISIDYKPEQIKEKLDTVQLPYTLIELDENNLEFCSQIVRQRKNVKARFRVVTPINVPFLKLITIYFSKIQVINKL